MAIKKYTDRNLRPFAPINLEEKWRLFKCGSAYKFVIIALVCVVAIGFYLGKKDTSSNSVNAIERAGAIATQTTESTKPKVKTLIVYITGEVNDPGVVEVDEGSRLFEAIEMVGGTTALANIVNCDMAAKLIDGVTIYIPKQGENIACSKTGSVSSGASNSGSGISASVTVNLNIATQAELETLPGVGPALASAIINYRDENGGFSSVSDLRKVSGIGDKKFSDLKDLVTV